ncbi:MAG: DUF3052 domain-containing protein [Bacteroidia bacterium]|nr:DUF3052 domain-containing protein [Bacteroidia bacterium]
MSAGYSQTPLAKKLGIKPGFSMLLHQAPDHYFELFADLPQDLQILEVGLEEGVDFIHLFCTEMSDLEAKAELHKSYLKKTGLMWVSWPKGKSKIPTDLKREPIRDHLLSIGLVDVKVAAIDEDWSGLKFVYRVKDR